MDEARALIFSAREIFERALHSAIGSTETAGSCLYASIVVCELLNKFTAGRAMIRGGGPPDDGGALDPQGNWRGHYWVEFTINEETFIVDITSDQFGYPPVTVLPISTGRYKAGCQLDVNASVTLEMATMGISS